MENETLMILFGTWFTCGIAGAIIGSSKNAAFGGFILGFFLGPLGVIAAFAIDGRRKCPKCATRVNAGASICPQCRSEDGFAPNGEGLPCASTDDSRTEEAYADRIRAQKNLPPRTRFPES